MKTYIIYLKDNDLSIKLAKDAQKSCERFGLEYEMFDGVPADKAIDVMKLHDLKPSNSVKKEVWTKGTIGCVASHFLLWKKCSEQDENFVIMEHDGLIIRDPRLIENDVVHACHLDASVAFNSNYDADSEEWFYHYEKSFIDNNKPGVRDHPSVKFYGNQDIIGGTFRGAYGYMITPAGAKRLVNFVRKYGVYPADQCLCETAVKLQRAKSTYVRLHPFFKTLNKQRENTTRL